MYGYVGLALLTPVISVAFGSDVAVTPRIGFDAFVASFGAAVTLGLALASLLGISLRARRQPLSFLAITGRIYLGFYTAALVYYIAIWILPQLVVNRDLITLVHIMAIALVLFSPAAIFIWRMIRDPALR